MRVVIQRVSRASVSVGGKLVSAIERGLLVLVGVEDSDTDLDIRYLSSKIVGLRVFDDKNGVMNLSVKDVDGEVLLVSQFTLHASTAKGNRPSYIRASKGDVALPMYERLTSAISMLLEKKVKNGVFGADMKIDLCNDGPVTIIIDSKQKDI